MEPNGYIRDRIVDTALERAQASSWEALRLHEIAHALGITLEDIRQEFPEKEAIAEAWFDRADAAMLARAARPEFAALNTHERLHAAIMTWLEALAAHRRVTRQIILGKLEPGHLHVQIPGLLRISRTVQWFREAALRNATYVRRALEETTLTTIYLAAFAHWLRDESPEAERTRRLLDRMLRAAGWVTTDGKARPAPTQNGPAQPPPAPEPDRDAG